MLLIKLKYSLIARINMLCTFEDYLKQRWKRTLTQKEKEKIVNIIKLKYSLKISSTMMMLRCLAY